MEIIVCYGTAEACNLVLEINIFRTERLLICGRPFKKDNNTHIPRKSAAVRCTNKGLK